MPILDSEIIWRPAALTSDATPAQNGGRMNKNLTLVSGVKNNLFPDVSQSERTNGAVKYRKAFIHLNSVQTTPLLNARLFIDALTPGGDFVTFVPGTQTDTEDQATGRGYGIGTLNAAVSAGATSVQVNCENNTEYATLQPFRVGDVARVSNKPAVGGTGTEDWPTITAVSYGVSFATLTVSPALANAYATNNTLVSSVKEYASVAGGIEGVSKISQGGTFDSATAGNIVVSNAGGVSDTWTLTFTSLTAFTVSGLLTGAVADIGDISTDYYAYDPLSGYEFFTILAQAFGGNFIAGDSVTFSTSPAAIPVWYRRQIPAGTASLANDFASLAIHGESA